ncbi:MAG: hypothetical protein K6C14_03765 [Eubacterium sp.]|nr:hypothetical protein [Eubacterium sp.]
MKKGIKSAAAALIAFTVLLTFVYITWGTESGGSAHVHSYKATAFKDGKVYITCETCFETEEVDFADRLALEDGAIDLVGDGIINAKDYAYFIRESHYYSDLEKAVGDSCSGGFARSDADVKNAAAQLSYINGRAFITLFCDESGAESISLTADAVINLNGKTVAFKDGGGLSLSADDCILNGTLSSENSAGVITVLSGSSVLNGLTVNGSFTQSLSEQSKLINVINGSAALNGVSVNAQGTGDGSCNIYGVYSESAAQVNADGLAVDMNCNGFARIEGAELGGASVINGFTANVLSDDSGTWGIRTLQGSDTVINGADIYSASANTDHGLGMVLNGKTTVNSTADAPVHCFGKRQGISTSPYEKTIVNGGEYSSCEHIVYVTGNADFYNCVFINAHREDYSNPDSAYCVYLGHDRCPENAVCSFYSCRFGSTDYSGNKYGAALVSTNNYHYRSLRDINLYDCDIYGGSSTVFCYNYPDGSNISTARFNLYGSTRIFANSAGNPEVSGQTLGASVSSWKTKTLYNSSTNTYSARFLGDRYISGNCAKVNTETGEIEEIYLTADANVYDYR